MDMAGSAKNQRYVIKVAKLGLPFYSFQPVEADREAITAQFGIEYKSVAFAESGAIQGHAGRETPIRVLPSETVSYLEPYGFL